MLSETELSWLAGMKEISKAYERKLRFSIRNKLKALVEEELPLLVNRGFISDVTANRNGVTEFSSGKQPKPFSSSKIKSLGRDLDPGPLPYQGNALPG
jgi:hypothetical protein